MTDKEDKDQQGTVPAEVPMEDRQSITREIRQDIKNSEQRPKGNGLELFDLPGEAASLWARSAEES